jgi:hypothetical protein
MHAVTFEETNMRHTTALLIGALLASTGLQAEVPVFRDQVLTIDEAVVFNSNGAAYYGDIRMKANADGSFSVIGADRRNLAPVSAADVQISKSKPVQVAVHVTGILSIACVALEEAGVSREGNTFHVVLAETNMPAGTVCMSLIATTPYDITIPLDTKDLPAGNYNVNVNGKLLTFTL